MTIRVAHVVRQYYPSVGGMEDVVQNIARHQRIYHGHQSKIVTLNRLFKNSAAPLEPRETVDDIDVIRLPYRGSSRYPICPQVLRQIADSDVVHVHGIDFFFDYLAMTKPIHRKPLVASTHGGFFHTNFLAPLKKIYFHTATKASCQAYDRIVATSNNDGDIFSGIVEHPKLTVIENGVNVEKYRDLAAPMSRPVMIYFGRWSTNKGLHATIALFAQLASTHPDWRLIVAGREYDHDAEELRALPGAFRFADAVQIVPNPSDQELARLIGQASYFICLSRHEGFGIAPVEAMSAGLTPILSDIPPFRHLVERSGFGLLVNPAAPGHTIAALLALHAQSAAEYIDRRRHLQHFASQYDWRHVADQYVDIYTELVNSHG